MKSRRFIAKNMCNFYEEVSEKMKNKLIRLQTDQEFNQNKIKKIKQKTQCSNVFGKCLCWKR